MSADNYITPGKDEVTFVGVVDQQPYAQGSKSEHNAVLFITNKERLLLRQRGANAFNNPELEKLVGKKIKATGQIRGNVFLIRSWITI